MWPIFNETYVDADVNFCFMFYLLVIERIDKQYEIFSIEKCFNWCTYKFNKFLKKNVLTTNRNYIKRNHQNKI